MGYKDEGETRRFERYKKPVSRRVPYVDPKPEEKVKKDVDAASWLINAFTVLILVVLASYGLLVFLGGR